MFAITWRPFGTHRINKRLSCQLRGARFGFPIARAAIEIALPSGMLDASPQPTSSSGAGFSHFHRRGGRPQHHRQASTFSAFVYFTFTMQIPDTAMRYAKFLYTLDVLWMTAL
jgi:hypothetical protein